MKRTLRIVDDQGRPPTWHLLIEGTRVAVDDTGDGRGGATLCEALVQAGAERLEPGDDASPDVRIVVRGTAPSQEARRRAAVLEQEADVVLGSARPAFATHFASACAERASR